MPRRPLASAVTTATAPGPIAPVTPSLSPIIQALRKDWRWASISQFINMFSDAFGLLGFDIETLEIDLDSTENGVLLDVIAKLLYALTWNRNINRENAFEHLRKQYLKRLPRQNPFGTLEEPIDWYGLGLGVKVQAIHQLCEWQLAEPARFRQLLKSDEDAVTWRIDPIGWDKAGNTYWLFDDNRLWVQHPSPAPPRPPKKVAPLKAKKAVSVAKRKPPPKKRAAPPTPEPGRSRKRTKVAPYGNLLPVDLADVEAEQPTKSTRSSLRRSAAHPAVKQASMKAKPVRATRNSRRSDGWEEVPEEWLAPATTKDDDDSSELSELTDLESDKASSVLSEPTPDSDAGADEDVEMNEATPEATTKHAPEVEEAPKVEEPAVESTDEVKVDEPEQGVEEVEPGQGAQAANSHAVSDESVVDRGGEAAVVAVDVDVVTKEEDGEATAITNGVEADGVAVKLDESEVKPSEEPAGNQNGEIKPEAEPIVKPEALPAFFEEEFDETDEVQVAARAAKNPSFLEWECICVTLYEWQHVGERFQNLSHRDEKALHKLLVNDIAPKVIEVLQAKENERLKEEAVVNRKRSSRIAVRELEKEEAMKREEAHREAEERMERARRAERRQLVVEAETVQKSREARLREREERMKEREEAAVSNAVAESQGLQRPHLLAGDTDSEYDSPAPRAAVRSLGTSGTSTPKVMQAGAAKSQRSTERWQLACEVCALTGWNLNNETEIVSCDICGRWQHVGCHDRADAAAGRPPRDWDRVDFKCRDCQLRARGVEEVRHQSQQQSASLNGAPYRPQQQHAQPQARPLQHPHAPAPTAYAHSSQARAPSYPLHAPGYPSPAPSYGSPVQGHVQSPSSYSPPVNYSPPASNGHHGYHHYGAAPQYMPRPPPPNIPHQHASPRVAQPVASSPYNGQQWRPSPQLYAPASGPQYQPYGTQPARPAQQHEAQPFHHLQSHAQQSPTHLRQSPLQHVQQPQIRQSPAQGYPQLPPVQPPRQG